MKSLILPLLLVSLNANAFFGQVIPRDVPRAYVENEAKVWSDKGRCPFEMENKSRSLCFKLLKEKTRTRKAKRA